MSSNPVVAVPTPKPSLTTQKKAGLAAWGDLDAVKADLERKKREAPSQVEDEGEQLYEINPAVQIDRNHFDAEIKQFATELKADNKMNLASALENGRSDLHHNRWRLTLDNELSFQVLEKEKTVLPYLRERLGIKDLFLELIVDENQVQTGPEIPYSPEEKLQAMARENPSLQRLQEIFRTRIIY